MLQDLWASSWSIAGFFSVGSRLRFCCQVACSRRDVMSEESLRFEHKVGFRV